MPQVKMRTINRTTGKSAIWLQLGLGYNPLYDPQSTFDEWQHSSSRLDNVRDNCVFQHISILEAHSINSIYGDVSNTFLLSLLLSLYGN